MFRECLLVPSIFVLFRSSYGASLYTASLDRAEIVNSTYSPGFYNISLYRINKINRTTFALNANLQFFVDIDENVFLEVEAHYKRLQNQDYMKSPYGMAHKAFPDHIKKHYELAKATLDSLAKCSNIPGVESIDKPYSWKKGSYWIKNFVIGIDGLPSYLPIGYYRVSLKFSTREAILELRLYVQIQSLF